MPVNYKDYHPMWKRISRFVRLIRAKNKCEQCGAPHLETIARAKDGTYMNIDGEVFNEETGEYLGMARGSEYMEDRFVKIVLTVAHLDHDPKNNDLVNLKALCQRCHLAHDRKDNNLRRKYGKNYRVWNLFTQNS
ncbi:hypothetical protein ACFQ4C_17960 [Larkinella insperata]|uniref:HNH endonuclease n=1 Tax=Larkinella insperata TaxID=332158 RepID=A0ABW3QBR0_9BACT|nr:hypothetical protein [Larkinella insperata]